MAKKKVNLSERVKLPDKYKRDGLWWMRDVPERIKIQQRSGRENRRQALEELQRPPAPGMGLDGYPLQKRVKSEE